MYNWKAQSMQIFKSSCCCPDWIPLVHIVTPDYWFFKTWKLTWRQQFSLLSIWSWLVDHCSACPQRSCCKSFPPKSNLQAASISSSLMGAPSWFEKTWCTDQRAVFCFSIIALIHLCFYCWDFLHERKCPSWCAICLLTVYHMCIISDDCQLAQNLQDSFTSSCLVLLGDLGTGQSPILRALSRQLHVWHHAKINSHQFAIPAWVLSGEIQGYPYDHTAMNPWQHDHLFWRLCQGRATPSCLSECVLVLARRPIWFGGKPEELAGHDHPTTVHLRDNQVSLIPWWFGLATIGICLEPGTSTWLNTQFTRLSGEKWRWRQNQCSYFKIPP